jgi:hypothetical protein
LGAQEKYAQDAIAEVLKKNGIELNDQRLKISDVTTNTLVRNCIHGNLIIPDWEAFRKDIQ